MSDAPILVTGAPRTGTTWIGEMLCASGEAAYVHEPFNIEYHPHALARPLPHQLFYICDDNGDEWRSLLRPPFDLRFPLIGRRPPLWPPRRPARIAVEWARVTTARRRHRVPVVKDPIALLSTEWLAATFGARPVVTIRHPAAFAASRLRIGWHFDFRHLAEQPLGLRDHFAADADEIRDFAAAPRPILEQSILLWRLLHGVIDGYRQRHPDWIFVRHEDVSAEPIPAFERLYAQLGLTFDDTARGLVRSTSQGEVATPAAGELGTLRRDSRGAAQAWRTALDDGQVERIRQGVGSLAERFFDDSEW